MKKILTILVLTLAVTPVFADGDRGGGWERGGHWGHAREWEHGDGGGGFWILPALIGGAVLYDLTRPPPEPVYVQPAPYYVQPAPSYDASATVPAGSYWYYCAASRAYYPYVASCPAGWQTVPATPPAPPH